MDLSIGSIALVLKIIYFTCMVVMFLYGLNSLVTVAFYLRNRRQMWQRRHSPQPRVWPAVTVQLPVFNEIFTVKRLLQAVVNLDYPTDRLQIQVLDDSTDSTASMLQTLVENYQNQGINIQFIHRSERRGFKAGALAEGMQQATGEFIAIFDADFVPPSDWLKRVVPEFTDPAIGFVQTRWSHINHKYNLLTRLESLALDGHFVVEQSARSAGGLLMGFNGSAGAWRRTCIEDAGGWSSDTLTEDLDLSYRAQLCGWRPVYLPDLVVPGEVPPHMDAVKKQQFRWAKGSAQTARKLAPALIKSSFPLYKRVLGLIHLTMYFPFAVLVFTLLLALPLGLYAPEFLKYFAWTALASLGPPVMYALARTDHLPRLIDRLLRIPGLALIGFGFSLSCGLGVVSGLIFNGGVFERTPKYDLDNSGSDPSNIRDLIPRNPITLGEIAMAAYNLVTVYVLWPTVGKGLAPWLLTSAAGFMMVAGTSLWQGWRKKRLFPQRSRSRQQPVAFH